MCIRIFDQIHRIWRNYYCSNISSTMAQFADKLPYEEMDPCCQREIDENRKYNEVTRILRENDRSTKRLDMKNRAVKSLRSFRCECCSSSRDYPILAKLRELEASKRHLPVMNEHDDFSKDKTEDSDEDEDDLEFLTPYEIERMNQVKAQIERLEKAKVMGFATHVEDSVEHLVRDLKATSTPIVLHLYDPNSMLCGELDLSLENLAPRYMGTKFRRLAYSPYLQENPLLQEYNHVLSNIYASNAQHALLCFVNKAIVTHTYTFSEFADLHTGTIHSSDLEKFLDQAHVLAANVSVEDMKYYRSIDEGGPNDDEDDEEGGSGVERNTYCDDPDCTRYFPHEHIGAGGRGSGAGGSSSSNAASFMRVAQKGEEALASNTFRTV